MEGPRKTWTRSKPHPLTDDFIREGYARGESTILIAKRCGLTSGAIRSRAMKMGIRHPTVTPRQMSPVKIRSYSLLSYKDRSLWEDNWSMPEPNTGCWLWTGAETDYGYGTAGKDGKTVLAHRISYEVFVGEIPKGLAVLHKCDNRSCVNPSHLFVGTNRDNIEDKVRKGRAWFRYSPEQVKEARELYKRGGITQQKIADLLGMPRKYVTAIVTGTARQRDQDIRNVGKL